MKESIAFRWTPPCAQAVYHAELALALATARLERLRARAGGIR